MPPSILARLWSCHSDRFLFDSAAAIPTFDKMPLDFLAAFWAYPYLMGFWGGFSRLFDNSPSKIDVFIRYPQLRPGLNGWNFADSCAQILIRDHGFDAVQIEYVPHVLN